MPFGAFGHVMEAEPGRLGVAIPQFVAMLRARFPNRMPAIVVDDAHLLDGGSAALVLAQATTGAARLVVTIRSGATAPDAITALWKERGLERIELQPLGPPDVRRLVAALLAGSVHTAAHERIYDLSQGNPLFVRELVHDARRTGALHVRDGRWHWREELVTFERLRVLVERRTLDVSLAAQPALELIALGAPVPLAVVGGLSSHDAVEELERLGLVAVRGSGPAAEIRLEHPLYGEVVAARMPATTRMRLRRSLAVSLQRSPTSTTVVACASRSGSWTPARPNRSCSSVQAHSRSGAAIPRSGFAWQTRQATGSAPSSPRASRSTRSHGSIARRPCSRRTSRRRRAWTRSRRGPTSRCASARC